METYRSIGIAIALSMVSVAAIGQTDQGSTPLVVMTTTGTSNIRFHHANTGASFPPTQTSIVVPVIGNEAHAYLGRSDGSLLAQPIKFTITYLDDGWYRVVLSGFSTQTGYFLPSPGTNTRLRETQDFDANVIDLDSGVGIATLGFTMYGDWEGQSGGGTVVSIDLSTVEGLLEGITLALVENPGDEGAYLVDISESIGFLNSLTSQANQKLDDIAGTNNQIATVIEAVQVDTAAMLLLQQTTDANIALMQPDLLAIRELLEDSTTDTSPSPGNTNHDLPLLDSLEKPAFATYSSSLVAPNLPTAADFEIKDEWRIFDRPADDTDVIPPPDDTPPVWNMSIPISGETSIDFDVDWSFFEQVRIPFRIALISFVSLMLGWRVFEELRRYG